MPYEGERLKSNGHGETSVSASPRVTAWTKAAHGGGVLGWVASHSVALLSVALVIASSAAIGLGVTANNLRAQNAGSAAASPSSAPASPSAAPAPTVALFYAANWTGFTSSPFAGSVTFAQAAGSPSVTVTVALSGLPQGAHGFHVHALTDLSAGCGTAGHYNPLAVAHAYPAAASSHAGDLGNLFADTLGNAAATFSSSRISLDPAAATFIGGQTLMVHAGADDGVTQPTGNAGGRLGCSLITAPARATASVWAGGTSPSAAFAGQVAFSQPAGASAVAVSVALTGLPPGFLGLHVHDMTTAPQGCGTAGHLNPFAMPHSLPSNVTRHLGDLGNIFADADGTAQQTFTDHAISLVAGSPSLITGFVVVVHSGADDGTTQPTGGAGSRLGCAVINAA